MQAHRQIGGSSAAISAATLGAVVMPCLYTKQKTKKRKTFTDGILKVSESNGLCILYSASDTFISAKEGSLESQFISPQEAKKVLQGEYTEIEFESYFVTVERIIQASTVNAALKQTAVSFKIPRFKPPSYTPSVKPIEKEITVTEKPNESMIMKTNKRNMYNVGVSELEELWGEDDEEWDDENNDGGIEIDKQEEERKGLGSLNNNDENQRSTDEWSGKNSYSHHNHNSTHNDNYNKQNKDSKESKPYNAWDGLDERSDNSVNRTFSSNSDNRNYQSKENARESVCSQESRKGTATYRYDDDHRIGEKQGNENCHSNRDRDRERDRQREREREIDNMNNVNDDASGGRKNDFDIWGGDSSVWGTLPSPPPLSPSSHSTASHPPSFPSSSSHSSSSTSFPSSSSTSSSSSSTSSTRPPPSRHTPSHERGPNLENSWGTSAHTGSNDDYAHADNGVSKETNNYSNNNDDKNGNRNVYNYRNDNRNDYGNENKRGERNNSYNDNRISYRINEKNGSKIDDNYLKDNRNNYYDENRNDGNNRDDGGNKNGNKDDNRNVGINDNNDSKDDYNNNDINNEIEVKDSSQYFNSFADQIIYDDINTSYQTKIDKNGSETNEYEINYNQDRNENEDINENNGKDDGYGISKDFYDEDGSNKNEIYSDDKYYNMNNNDNDINDDNHNEEYDDDNNNHYGTNINIARDSNEGNATALLDGNARTSSPPRTYTPPSHTPDTPPLSPSLFNSTSTPDNTTFTLPSHPPSTQTLPVVPKFIENVPEHSVSAEHSLGGNINAQEEKNIWDF